MDIFIHSAGASHSLDGAFSHIGAWCDDIPSSAYSTSFDICQETITHPLTFEKQGKSDENSIATPFKTKITETSKSNLANTKTQAHISSKHIDPEILELQLAKNTSTKPWVMETAREGPWKVIETASTAFGSKTTDLFTTDYKVAGSETGAVDGDAISNPDPADAGQGLGNPGAQKQIHVADVEAVAWRLSYLKQVL